MVVLAGVDELLLELLLLLLPVLNRSRNRLPVLLLEGILPPLYVGLGPIFVVPPAVLGLV